jgi:hypothetical protein
MLLPFTSQQIGQATDCGAILQLENMPLAQDLDELPEHPDSDLHQTHWGLG